MNRILPVIAIVLALVAAGAWWLTQGGQTPEPQQTSVSATSGAGVDAAQDDAAQGDVIEMVLGDADAPVTLIEYASFTCPHCATFHEQVFRSLKADYIDTGKVKMVFRDVYFDRVGLWASMVARCGGAERFWGMTDLMMKTQSDWARSGDPVAITAELKKIGRLAGLDDTQLQACMQDEDKAKSLVAWSEKNMGTHDVKGTPTLIINGTKHPNMSYSDLKPILDAQIGG
ncbi:DsbA family protein [Shimia sp.]|uniref:DsbA family protein n=1 Tax=Shimia sp. TaxID=1954381 RepID=UPI003564F585